MQEKDDTIRKLGGTILDVKKQDTARQVYQAIKGDIVDEMLARYINQTGV